MTDSRINEIYKYQKVDEKLSTAGQPTEEQIESIKREGFDVVINLALHNVQRYSLPDEAGLVKSYGMKYIHIPVEFDSPQESDLLRFFDAMQDNSDKKIFVHCAANMRVSAFLALYNPIRLCEPDENAFSLMKSIWLPDEVWTQFISAMLEKYRK